VLFRAQHYIQTSLPAPPPPLPLSLPSPFSLFLPCTGTAYNLHVDQMQTSNIGTQFRGHKILAIWEYIPSHSITKHHKASQSSVDRVVAVFTSISQNHTASLSITKRFGAHYPFHLGLRLSSHRITQSNDCRVHHNFGISKLSGSITQRCESIVRLW
jgi:hypothetical protein